MENQHNTNVAELSIELSPRQSTMKELEWYKESCEEGGIGYYNAYKNLDRKDIDDNRRRLQLVGILDEIIEKWYGHELPSDFQSQNKWINAGFAYRRLVEPLDIAEYYRTFEHCTTYERPKRRHKVLQQWMEDKEKTRSSRGKKHMIYRFSESDGHIYRFLDSKGHNFDIKSLDPTKMTQEAYDMLVDIIEFFESLRLYKLFLRAMTRCFIAMNTFLSLKVESSDSKAKIQEIKAKLQDQFNYNGNCNVKIGIIPCPGGEFKENSRRDMEKRS